MYSLSELLPDLARHLSSAPMEATCICWKIHLCRFQLSSIWNSLPAWLLKELEEQLFSKNQPVLKHRSYSTFDLKEKQEMDLHVTI